MRPVGRAYKLEHATTANFLRLQKLLAAGSAGSWDRISEDLVAYVAIEAQNTWANFARAYYFSCFIETRLTSGAKVRVSPVFAGSRLVDAQGHAINRFRTKKLKPDASGKWDPRDEPSWFNSDRLLDLCTDLGCSHLAGVRAALSPRPQALDSLPTFRHFFAHRSESTTKSAVAEAAGLGLPTARGPAAALVYRPSTSPCGTLDAWLAELASAAHRLCA